jgi:two-component system chemotaxis response regulator CheB
VTPCPEPSAFHARLTTSVPSQDGGSADQLSAPCRSGELTTLAIASGPGATAVVLSGGGHDGAIGATAIHDFGGASDQASSTPFTMPQATIERDNILDHVVALELLASLVSAPRR